MKMFHAVMIAVSLVAFFANPAKSESPLPDTQWEVKVDPAGWPVMMNSNREYGVIFSIGYNQSAHCGDIRLLIGNIVPAEPLPAGLPDPLLLPSEMELATVGDINLGNGEVAIYNTGENMLLLYTYTPADALIVELINSDKFAWWDGVFKDGARSYFNNTGFVENLNTVTKMCFEKTKNMPKKGDVTA
jgi:hypothetical protein